MRHFGEASAQITGTYSWDQIRQELVRLGGGIPALIGAAGAYLERLAQPL